MATLTQWKILTTLTKRSQGTQSIREKLAREGINLSLRSVQRNLDRLSEHFPITSDHNNPAGWKWANDCDLFDLPVMDVNTALVLQMVEHYLSPMVPKGCLDRLHPYMRRAENLLDEVGAQGVGGWSRRVVRIAPTHHLLAPDIDSDVLDSVFQAVLEQRQLSIMYRAIGEEVEKERVVHPLGLAFAEGVIYLVGRTWDYEDIRHYALHRMVSGALLDVPARRDDDFDLSAYAAEGHFEIHADGEMVRLKLRVDNWLAHYLEESRLAPDQTIRPAGDRHQVEATVCQTLQLKWWLLGLGSRVEVLEPKELRTAMTATINELYAIYQGEGQ